MRISIILIAILLTSTVYAACEFGTTKVKELNGISVDKLGPAKALLGKSGSVTIFFNDTNETYSFAVNNGILETADKQSIYVITTDTCTAQAIENGTIKPENALRSVDIKAYGLLASVKLAFAKKAVTVVGWLR